MDYDRNANKTQKRWTAALSMNQLTSLSLRQIPVVRSNFQCSEV